MNALIQFSNNHTQSHKKRRSATAIRHQGSPQAHLLNGSAPRQYMTKYTLPNE